MQGYVDSDHCCTCAKLYLRVGILKTHGSIPRLPLPLERTTTNETINKEGVAHRIIDSSDNRDEDREKRKR